MSTVAIHAIWTTYMTWPPGDRRGHWSPLFEFYGKLKTQGHQLNLPDPVTEKYATFRAAEPPRILTPHDQQIVAETIGDVLRNDLEGRIAIYAAAIERTHVHLLFGEVSVEVDELVGRIKSRTSSAVFKQGNEPERTRTWTTGFWKVFLFDVTVLPEVQRYIERHNERRDKAPAPYTWICLRVQKRGDDHDDHRTMAALVHLAPNLPSHEGGGHRIILLRAHPPGAFGGLEVFHELIVFPQPLDPSAGGFSFVAILAGSAVVAMWPKAHDPLLMNGKHAQHTALPQQGQVEVTAEARVPDEDITGPQVGVNLRRAGQIPGPQGRNRHVTDQSAGRGEQAQQMRHREAASGLLIARLPGVGSKLRSIGHGEARSIHMPGAMAIPEMLRLSLGHCFGGVANPPADLPHRLQWQSPLGRAVRRRRHLQPGQSNEFGIGDIAGQNLLGKQRDRDRRGQRGLPSFQTQLPADRFNNRRSDGRARIILDPLQRRGDTDHPWPPCVDVIKATPSSREAACCANVVKEALMQTYGYFNAIKHLRIKEMPFGSDRFYIQLWKRLAAAFMSLSSNLAKVNGQQSVQFYVPDGKYRKQVFAMEDLRDGHITIYCGDILDEAIKAKVFQPVKDSETADQFKAGKTGDGIVIEKIDGSTPNASEFFKHMVGWNRKAIRIILPITSNAETVDAVLTVCAMSMVNGG